MRSSRDPVHDIRHAERVADFAEKIGRELNLDRKRLQALILAAWWHDVGRTVTRKPSLIFMVFLDDLISALMLWRETIRIGLFGSVTGMATRLIFCHSVGTGTFLTRLLLRPKTRLLLDALMDADKLDMLSTERLDKLLGLASRSTIYHFGYRILSWYNFSTVYFDVKTAAARRHLEKILVEFVTWLYSPEIKAWHIEQFGIVWSRRMHGRVLSVIQRFHIRMTFDPTI
ncbi:MAG: hypothetical protein UY92_C0005G0021 [Candidatus Magasanikbacteria bacterium GW2011_GWA2_56_11]|uniref:HD/PDEase domain-containing protein n=1 Tax=Candidatus Magasanikbacteria bacterium GW2011_GWA2_56_11 TaxID=1619044 RepID=A0A0G2BAS3_9BACT|nr:MAG: hypothetical protein UY92_C0005G0021 [Candidatus Magasanikbacteria bacterium GW2011_GWA2_56_11]